MGYAYSGDRELADYFFNEKEYRKARAQYNSCLDNVMKYAPKNKQLIEYIKNKLKECNVCEQNQTFGKCQ